MAEENDGKKQAMAAIRERLKPDTMLKIVFNDGDEDATKNAKEPPRFLVGYWSIRGLAAPIRAMLSAAQVDHEVALYDMTEGPEDGWNRESYMSDKKWLREEYDSFMNLPFLVDSKRGIVLAQTNAILHYLGRELNMVSADEVELARIDEMLDEAMDLRNKMVGFVYRTNGTKEEAQAMLSMAKAHFAKFDSFLAKQYSGFFTNLEPKEDKGPKTADQAKQGVAHLIPGSFTAPDFHLWELLDQFEGLSRYFGLSLWAEMGEDQATSVNFQSRPDVKPCDRLYPFLEEFRNTFMALPENSHYIDSYLHNEIPCNNCSAKFASCYVDFKAYTRGQEAPWRKKGKVLVRYKKVN